MTFREHDIVILTCDLPEACLKRGDLGTVVHLYDAPMLEVEFTNATGDTIAMLPLSTSQLRGAAASDVAAVRTA